MRLLLVCVVSLLVSVAHGQTMNCTTLGASTNCWFQDGAQSFGAGVVEGLRSAELPAVTIPLPPKASTGENVSETTLARLEALRHSLDDLKLDKATKEHLWAEGSEALLDSYRLQH